MHVLCTHANFPCVSACGVNNMTTSAVSESSNEECSGRAGAVSANEETPNDVANIAFKSNTDILKKMRTLDDKIVYALNTSIPTESFRSKMDASSACANLHSQIQRIHSERDNMIKNCIVASADTVKNLKILKEKNPNDWEVTKNLRAEQTKLRILRSELSVEEVIKDKTTNVFIEKCRSFYKPPTVL